MIGSFILSKVLVSSKACEILCSLSIIGATALLEDWWLSNASVLVLDV